MIALGQTAKTFRRVLLLLFCLAPPPLLGQAPVGTALLIPCNVPGVAGDVRCGTLEVYENRAARAGRKIGLKIVVLGATGERVPDAVFPIAGGPGMGVTAGAAFTAKFFGYIREHHDIVLMDQRGTGGSNVLRCDLHAARKATGAMPDFLPPDAVRTCAEQLSRASDLTQYTLTNTVEDLDDVRAALGYEKIDMHALSYGTRVAQSYMTRHGDHVRAAVFEGVVPVGFHMPQDYPRHAQRALDAVLADCRTDASCAKLLAGVDVAKLAKRVDMQPPTVLFKGTSVRFPRMLFFEALRTVMYDAGKARKLPLFLRRAADGDFQPFADSAVGTLADDQTFSWGLFLNFTCTHDVPFIAPRDAQAAAAGTVFGDYRYQQQKEACRLWPAKAKKIAAKKSGVPVLLVSGEDDPVTPPSAAAAAAMYLRNSTQVVIPYGGHLLVGLDGIECLDHIEGAFLAAPLSQLDTSCLKLIRRLPWMK